VEEFLRSPWFTIPFAVFLLLLGPSIRDWASLILSRYSVRIRHKRRRRLIVMAQQVRVLKRDVRLLVVESVRFILLFFISFGLFFVVCIVYIVKMFNDDFFKKSPYIETIVSIHTVFLVLLTCLMFIFMTNKDALMRVNYEMRRRHHIDHKNIRKLIRAPDTKSVV
jgi:hypothetical protein